MGLVSLLTHNPLFRKFLVDMMNNICDCTLLDDVRNSYNNLVCLGRMRSWIHKERTFYYRNLVN